MEKEIYLIAPPAHQYELGALIREVWPLCKIYDQPAAGLRGIVVSPEKGSVSLLAADGTTERVMAMEEPEEGAAPLSQKNSEKKAVLDLLQASLPWGILTGVRPSKVAYTYLEAGLSEEETEAAMRRQYRLRSDKARLCTRVAAEERALLADHTGRDISLYVGIPFCPSRCSYCSFISHDQRAYQKWGDAYLEALIREMEQSQGLLEGHRLQSFYMGGGTPTTLSASELQRVLLAADRMCHFETLKEVTVEAGRPDTITREKLKMLKDMGVTRISINPQSMNQSTLDTIGRRHSVEEIETAFAMARQAGFTNINMDFIVGLPGETLSDVRHSMDRVMAMKPDNLTVHTLAIKRSSRMNEEGSGKMVLEKALREAKTLDAMLALTMETAQTLGMHPYYMYRQKNMAGNFENIGYSLPGHEGLYNIEIMEERQNILAFGAGGVSKVYDPERNRLERVPNVKSVDEYIRRIDEMIERKRKGAQAVWKSKS